MSVIPLTIFFSLLLAGLFIVLFAREQGRRRFASPERDSLLPLADETPHPVGADDHNQAAESCGCRDGTRPPRTGRGLRSPCSSECSCRENRGEEGGLRRTPMPDPASPVFHAP